MNVVNARKIELCLCRRCLEGFSKTGVYSIRRTDPIEVIREPCMVCQVGYGYDFVLAPRGSTKRMAAVMRRDSYVVNRAI